MFVDEVTYHDRAPLGVQHRNAIRLLRSPESKIQNPPHPRLSVSDSNRSRIPGCSPSNCWYRSLSSSLKSTAS